jgi:hypothetical protein
MVGSRSACSSSGPPSAIRGSSRAHRQQSLGQFRRPRGRPEPDQPLCRRDHHRSDAQFAARTARRRSAIREFRSVHARCFLDPADNVRLVELCGPLDEHLHLIERGSASKSGGAAIAFRSSGRCRRGKRAEAVLQSLYARAQREPVDPSACTSRCRRLGMEGKSREAGATDAPDELKVRTARRGARARRQSDRIPRTTCARTT